MWGSVLQSAGTCLSWRQQKKPGRASYRCRHLLRSVGMSVVTHPLDWYPVAFAAEPLQTLQIPDGAILGEWLAENIPGFGGERDDIAYSIPLDAPVHGRVIAQHVPKGSAIQSILRPDRKSVV